MVEEATKAVHRGSLAARKLFLHNSVLFKDVFCKYTVTVLVVATAGVATAEDKK